MTVKKAAVKRLKIKKATVNADSEYARGFVKKCTERGVDPVEVFKLADTLELHLV